MELIDPKEFGIRGKAVIKKTGEKSYVLEVNRKSRIIMADGKKILEKVERIQRHIPSAKITLSTTAPLCSKTIVFLEAKGICIKKA